MELLLLFLQVVLAHQCYNQDIPKKDSGQYEEIGMPDHEYNVAQDLYSDNSNRRSKDSKLHISFWLFTRKNPKKYQLLIDGNKDSIKRSNYRPNLPLIVITHGWEGNGSQSWIGDIKSAVLRQMNANVLVLDWSKTAEETYVKVVDLVPTMGKKLEKFLVWLIGQFGGKWDKVHLVGHSLGAHVVGAAGRITGGLPGRISGLDPAGPMWESNQNGLSRDSGVYVESIHTDGGLRGLITPISHVDFYPNGGQNPQPGCTNSSCSHARSTELFAASISNKLVGRKCKNLHEASSNLCRGDIKLPMGNIYPYKQGTGIYGLKTESTKPFVSESELDKILIYHI